MNIFSLGKKESLATISFSRMKERRNGMIFSKLSYIFWKNSDPLFIKA